MIRLPKIRCRRVRGFFALGGGVQLVNCYETGMSWDAKIYLGPLVVLIEPRRDDSGVGSDAVLAAAVAWWESFRNTGMTLSEHLARPTHQCINSCDRKLASAVALYVDANEKVAKR